MVANNSGLYSLLGREPATAALLSAESTKSFTANLGFGLLNAAIAPFKSCSNASFFWNLARVACEAAVRSTSR